MTVLLRKIMKPNRCNLFSKPGCLVYQLVVSPYLCSSLRGFPLPHPHPGPFQIMGPGTEDISTVCPVHGPHTATVSDI